MAAINITRVQLSDTFNIWRTRFNQSLDVIQSLTGIIDTTSAESGIQVSGSSIFGDSLTDSTTINGTLSVSSNATVTGDLALNGGDLTTTSTTASLFDTNATTLNIGRAATSIIIGATTGTTNIRNSVSISSGLTVSNNSTFLGDIAVNGGDITTTSTTATLFNSNATTVNIAEAGTSVSIGASTGSTTVNNSVSIGGALSVTGNTTLTGDIAVNGGDITTNSLTATIFNSNATTVNIANFATNVTIGSTTGTTTIRNSASIGANISVGGTLSVTGNTTFTGDIAVNGGDITTTSSTATVFNTTSTSVNIAGAATSVSIGSSSGTTSVNNNLTVIGNLTVNGTSTVINSTVTTLDDPVITLGGDTAPTADDNKDRGIEFRWHNGTTAKVGFFGFDDSTGYLTFIPDATNTSEVFAGTLGDIQASNFRGSLVGNASTATTLQTSRSISLSGDITGSVSFDGSQNVTIDTTIAANSVQLGADTSGDYISFGAVSGNGLTGSATGEGSTFTVSSNATSVNTGSTIVFRDGTGNFSAGTITASLSGNASTSTTLQTSRLINGVSFNGSADITVPVNSSDDLTTNGTMFPVFVSATGNSPAKVATTKLTFNPFTGTLTSTDYNSTSDVKLKTNVKTVSGLDIISKLRGVEFDFIDSGKHSSGVIAQEIEQVIPHLVSEVNDTKVVAYQQIIAYLIESIKEQQKQIDSILSQINN